MMASFFPELADATHTERTRDEDTLYEFQRKVGTKGAVLSHFGKLRTGWSKG